MAKELFFRAGASSSARATCFSCAMIAGFFHTAIHATTKGPGGPLDSHLTFQELKMKPFRNKTGRQHFCVLAIVVSSCALGASPASADTFFFSTGNPDGLIATLSRVASGF